MKVEEIIKGLEKVYGDELIMTYHISAVNHAIAFLKGYQGRVKELEEAIAGVVKAQKATGSNSVLMKIEDAAYELKLEREVLTSFYEEGDGQC